MAFYNASGQITIDEAAANKDINNIRQAVSKLEDSQNSLVRLFSAASTMQGQTGQAIVEQSGKLQSRIEALKTQLNRSASLIQSTVEKYREEDRQLAQSIRSGGGI